MKKRIRSEVGFSAIEALFILVAVGLIGFGGWWIYKNHHKESAVAKKTAATTIKKVDPYAGWQTFTDYTGSGFSMKYPADWRPSGETKSAAWSLSEKGNSKISIGARWSLLPLSNWSTPEQEWDDCPSLDACGHPASDKTLVSSTEKVNGNNVYLAKMQGSDGVYHVAVFQDGEASGGKIIYVELVLYSDAPSVVAIFNETVNSGTFNSKTSYLDIKEWGVHLTLDSGTASMYYYINPQLPDVAYLSLRSISDIAPDCAADKTTLGAISRLTTAEHDAALSNPELGIPGTIEINGYWYGFTHPQAGCIDGDSETAAVSQLPSYNILNAFNTIAAN